MKIRNILLFVLSVLLISSLLVACGENKTNGTASADEASIKETTVVLETTTDGGTVEKDPEGNKVTKDANGKVIAVEGVDGKPIDVTEYLDLHEWVESSPAGSDDSDITYVPNSTDSNGDVVEGEIPVVIATVPDEDTLETIPDF